MDVNRAKEIIESKDTFEVHLNGQSVWIDSVNAETQTATVHARGGQTESQTVRVDELEEI